MKTIKLLLVIFTVGLVITSCTTTQHGYYEDLDGDNTRRIGNQVYVDDPYYGTVVLERDPFTGRYYDVSNGVRGRISPYNSYNRYRSSYRNYPVYRNNNRANISRPVPNQKPATTQKDREEARNKILGNKN